jgi:ABC-type polysaccharide/polyol phosphate export permease
MPRVKDELLELWRFRSLLWQLVRRDLKVRYKNSRLGFFWSVAPPLMQVAVITFALKHATDFAKGFESYSAYVLAGMIPWTYFQTAVLDASQSILLMYGVIKKVYLPREIIPLAGAISNFIHFLLSWLVFFVYLWGISRAPILPTTLWLPYLAFVQFMLVTAICLLVACLNVFYEDVKYIVSILMSLALFVLPIIYVVEQPLYRGSRWLHGIGFQLYMLNPLTSLITGYRKALLEPPPRSVLGGPSLPLDVGNLLLTGLISFVLLVASYAYFNSRKWQFVERP